MNTNRTKLALRRQSIRTLTADELRIAHGGKGNNNGQTGTTVKTGTCIPTRTGTQQPTMQPTQTK